MTPPRANSAAARDIASVLLPFTELKTHLQTGPVVITRGEGVRVLDNFSTGLRDNIKPNMSKIELVEGDIRDRAALDKAMAGVDFVIHQAYVKVDEKGTEAAAATAVGMKLTAMPSPSNIFNADHPFIFLIQEKETGTGARRCGGKGGRSRRRRPRRTRPI